MTDGPRPTLSGSMVRLGPTAPAVIELQSILTLAVATTLRTHAGDDVVLLAAESARAAMLPLAQAYVDVREASRAEGITATRAEVAAVVAALELVAAELGAAVVAVSRLPEGPDTERLRTALKRAAEALAFATRASEVPPPNDPRKEP